MALWYTGRQEYFLANYKDILVDFISVSNGLVCSTSDGVSDIEGLIKKISCFLSKKRNYRDVFAMLQGVYASDNGTFVHSLNVALICYVFAGWLGFTKAEQRTATLCGLFHDVGKVSISEEIIKKPGKLTDDEREEMKKHTINGYNLLVASGETNVHVCNAALMHHERMDGSGYPYGLGKTQIDKFARIVAIADVYDALTAERAYRKAMRVDRVLSTLQEEKEGYDEEYLTVFLRRSAQLMDVV